MSKILVTKAVGVDYSLSGQPVMVLGGGRGGNRPRGRTLRERAGGILGGTVGVLGALTGQHRSLGGLAQSMISGGAQGAGLGSALGRKTVGRVGQARADIREAGKQARAEEDARLAEATRSRGQGPMSGVNPMARIRRGRAEIQDKHQQELERVNRANRAREAAQQERQQVLVQQARNKRQFEERARQAKEIAAAKARGTQFGDEDRVMAEAGRTFVGRTGITPQQYAEGMNRMGVAVVNARGEPQGDANQIAQLPQNSKANQSPPGSVGSGNETADRVGQGVTDAQGFNNTTEGEPSDLESPAAMQPPEGQGQLSPEQLAAIRQQMGPEAMQRLQQQQQQQPQQCNQQSTLTGKFGNLGFSV